MDDKPISDEEQREADEFYAALGRAIGKWSSVEYVVGLMFGRLMGGSNAVTLSVFHSARSWRARADMMKAALGGVTGLPGMVGAWMRLVKLADDYSQFRNIVAHNSIQFNAGHSGPLGRKMSIRQQTAPLDSDDGAPVITKEDLDTATSNFQLLYGLVTHALQWDGSDQLGSPERLLLLANQLPSPPHSKRADPSVLEQIELGLERQSYPR